MPERDANQPAPGVEIWGPDGRGMANTARGVTVRDANQLAADVRERLTGLAAIVVLAWACHIHHTFPR